jgi:flagellar basal-body rod modification protein FlgD
MSVQGVNFANSAAYTAASEANGSGDMLSRDVFLNLLVTQLRNQDPLDPMNNQEFLSQLASLSQVEEQRATNENLKTLQLYQSSINNAQSLALIGKEVKASGDSINLQEGENVDMHFYLDSDAHEVEVTIYDEGGSVVRQITKSNMDSGDQKLAWDGKDMNNSPLAEGAYTFEVSATNEIGDTIPVQTMISGRVTSVSFANGAPELEINGQKVVFGSLYEVME